MTNWKDCLNDSDVIDAASKLDTSFHTYEDDNGVLYHGDETYLDEDGYEWSNGVSKVCITIPNKTVLKTSIDGTIQDYDWDTGENLEVPIYTTYPDYCKIEYEIYEAAKAKGLDYFFAEILPMGGTVYAQECYTMTVDDFIFSEEGKDYFADFKRNRPSENEISVEGLDSLADKFDAQTFALFYWTFSTEELIKLQDFLDEYDINDLHAGNIGFFNGDLKIFDYCGFDSSTAKKVEELKVS